MGLTGDCYRGVFEGHTIEFVLDNWTKTAALHVDDKKVVSRWRMLPHNIILSATFESNGIPHTVVAKSFHRFPFSMETFELDGDLLPMTKTK